MNIAKTLTRNSYVLFQNEKICQMLNSASQQFSNLGNLSSLNCFDMLFKSEVWGQISDCGNWGCELG